MEKLWETESVKNNRNGCSPLTTYNLKIFTADRNYIGTKVYLKIFGENAVSSF